MIIALIISMVGLIISALFMILGWLDSWIYFSILIVAALCLVDEAYNLLPISIVGMLSLGTFTKISWIDPVIFFSIFIVTALILAQKIVAKQMNTGGDG